MTPLASKTPALDTVPLSLAGEQDLVFTPAQRRLLVVVTALLVLSSPFWIGALFFSGPYEYGTALLLVPLVWLLNIAAILRITGHAPALRRLMLVSFALKMACAGGYIALLYVYYGNGGDATTYFAVGKQWAAFFGIHGNYPVVGHIWGTSFINLLTAMGITALGPTIPTISVLFASAGWWGLYFFYRVFRQVFPEGRKEFGALLIFLLPSSQFWTAAIGKDALMLLSIGLISLGFAYLMNARIARAFAYILPSMALGALVRPHVAGMVAIAMLVPYTFSKVARGPIGALTKIIGVPVMIAGVAYLLSNATQLLKVDSTVGGLERISKFSTGTMHGGSAFGQNQGMAVKLLLSPFLMFRPFPWEVPNALGIAATLEALMLLYFLWRVRSDLLHFLTHWRESPFFLYALAFGAIFSVAFTLAISNFGLLIRQRTQYTPFLLILAASALPWRRVRHR